MASLADRFSFDSEFIGTTPKLISIVPINVCYRLYSHYIRRPLHVNPAEPVAKLAMFILNGYRITGQALPITVLQDKPGFVALVGGFEAIRVHGVGSEVRLED